MKKLLNISLIGICLILAGIVMIFSENIGVNYAKIIVPLLFALAGYFSLTYGIANKEKEVASKFQIIQGIGLLVFAAVIAFLPDSLKSFLLYVTYFMLMFGLLELMFSFSVLNSKNKVIKQILIFRLIAGLLTAVGAVILLLATITDEYEGLMAAGALTVLIGLSNIIFAMKLKKNVTA